MNPQSFGSLSKPARQLHFRGGTTVRSLLETLLENLQKDEDWLRWLVEFGAVYVNSSRVMDPALEVAACDLIRVHVEPKRYLLDKADLRARVIFENDNFLVVNKPSGLPMHPTLDNFCENLVAGFDHKVFVTHRLDVPTSGLCVLAKTKKYQSEFNKLISRRAIQKNYRALVQKPLEPGLLRHFMKVSVKAPKEIVRKVPAAQSKASAAGINEEQLLDGQIPTATPVQFDECLLKIISVNPSDRFFELEIELLTGRTHQIRAQLAFEGSPIAGDEMYGGAPSETFGLCASGLKFQCPVSGQVFELSLTN